MQTLTWDERILLSTVLDPSIPSLRPITNNRPTILTNSDGALLLAPSGGSHTWRRTLPIDAPVVNGPVDGRGSINVGGWKWWGWRERFARVLC